MDKSAVMKIVKTEFEKLLQEELIQKEKEVRAKVLLEFEKLKTELHKKYKEELLKHKKELSEETNKLKTSLYKEKQRWRRRSSSICNQSIKNNDKKIPISSLMEKEFNTLSLESERREIFEILQINNNKEEKKHQRSKSCLFMNEDCSLPLQIKDNEKLKDEEKQVESFHTKHKLEKQIEIPQIEAIDLSQINKKIRKIIDNPKLSPPTKVKAEHISPKKEFKNLKEMEINALEKKGNQSPLIKKPSSPLLKGRYEILSLKVEESTPISLKDFGNFIVRYIEKEENFKLFMENNQTKILNKIRKKFEEKGKSDHCLLDYLMEIWNKINAGYECRFRILEKILKTEDIFIIYNILDSETEFLTEYLMKTDGIYKQIYEREKMKLKIQAKINRSKK
jgi:hypothetical protein